MANVLSVPLSGNIYFDCGSQSSTVPDLTGSAVSLGYDGCAGVKVTSFNAAASATDRFTVAGESGSLFSVNDSLTGTVFSVNDASGLPIIEVNSDATTDTIAIGEYGTNALFVSGGNVGVGTATPTYPLDVCGNINTTGNLLSGGSNLDTIFATSADIGACYLPLAGGTIDGSLIIDTDTGSQPFYVTRSGNPNESLKIYITDENAVFESIQDETADNYGGFVFNMYAGTTHPVFDVRKNHSTIMRVDGGGNVGIGTTTPSAKLEVNGHFAATTKSFIIDNPKTGGKLQYGVVESDQHSVLVRGKNDTETIELPEEWEWLVDEDSVTVDLTSIGQIQQLFVV